MTAAWIATFSFSLRGEFGRTPRLTSLNGKLGRDHYPQAMCALVSGGGIRMGQVVGGATSSRGEFPRERPLKPQDLLATVYQHFGIDPSHEFRDLAAAVYYLVTQIGEPQAISPSVCSARM